MVPLPRNVRRLLGESKRVVRAFVALIVCAASAANSANTPLSPEALGELLFNDKSLSADGAVACATCHQPAHAFADTRAVSLGVFGNSGARNAPSLLDVAQRPALAWDGRTRTIGEQVLVAFLHPREHGLADPTAIEQRLPDALTLEAAQAALAAYLATLRSSDSAFDRWRAGDPNAMSASAKRGYEIFMRGGQCAQCHLISGERPAFTDDDFHRVGVGLEAIAPNLGSLAMRVAPLSRVDLERAIAEDGKVAALGRFLVTRNPADIGKYRTPGLRNVAVTAPYFHDGSVATLEAAVAQEIYYRGQERGMPLSLGTAEQADLIAFLRALTDSRYQESGSRP